MSISMSIKARGGAAAIGLAQSKAKGGSGPCGAQPARSDNNAAEKTEGGRDTAAGRSAGQRGSRRSAQQSSMLKGGCIHARWRGVLRSAARARGAALRSRERFGAANDQHLVHRLLAELNGLVGGVGQVGLHMAGGKAHMALAAAATAHGKHNWHHVPADGTPSGSGSTHRVLEEARVGAAQARLGHAAALGEGVQRLAHVEAVEPDAGAAHGALNGGGQGLVVAAGGGGGGRVVAAGRAHEQACSAHSALARVQGGALAAAHL